MNTKPAHGIVISDVNLDNLRNTLNKVREDSAEMRVTSAPFGHVMPALLNPADPIWSENPEFAIVWTRPEGVIESFRGILDYDNVDLNALLDQVDEFAGAMLAAAQHVKAMFVPTWTVPLQQRGLGLLDCRPGGIAHTLQRMNARLQEQLAAASNIYVLDAQRWMQAAGPNAFCPKYWLLGKVPFNTPVFEHAAHDIRAAWAAVSGQTRKLIVLDLDDTLWGGIVGDDGWENLKLGGHNGVGESFVQFQRELKSLQRRGFLLAIVSKNREEVAFEAIEKHPEMVLRRDDFIAWRINWMDKAQNIADLVAEVNLGLQSVVFIDDNPSERARVKEQLPEVLVPDWPKEKMLYTEALQALTCFDSATRSSEDQSRTAMYVSERERRQAKSQVSSMEDWLDAMRLTVDVEPLDDANIQRVTQLLNKTNQMNLTTRRPTEQELREWAAMPGCQLFALRVSDRFGDSGLTGIVSMQADGQECRVVDFVLSCRVFGRQIENLMVHEAVRFAMDSGVERVLAEYLPTKKNKPCLEFWQSSGFVEAEDNQFVWDCSNEFPVPGHIQVNRATLV